MCVFFFGNNFGYRFNILEHIGVFGKFVLRDFCFWFGVCVVLECTDVFGTGVFGTGVFGTGVFGVCVVLECIDVFGTGVWGIVFPAR